LVPVRLSGFSAFSKTTTGPKPSGAPCATLQFTHSRILLYYSVPIKPGNCIGLKYVSLHAVQTRNTYMVAQPVGLR